MIRHKRRLQQKEVSLKTGISQSLISKYEHGFVRRVSYKNLKLLAEVYKCTTEDFSPDSIATRSYHVGKSDYSKRRIQPWDIWLEYNLNPWDADIIKRVLREKDERRLDYEKIKHICDERIRQIDGQT